MQRVAKPAATPAARDAETVALERELGTALGLKVQIAHDGRGGSVRISYRTLDQLDALLERLRG